MVPGQTNPTASTQRPSQSQSAQRPWTVVPMRYSIHMGIPFFVRPIPFPLSQAIPLPRQPPQSIFSAQVPSSLQHFAFGLQEAYDPRPTSSQQSATTHHGPPVNQTPLSQQRQRQQQQQSSGPRQSALGPSNPIEKRKLRALLKRDPKLSRYPLRTINLSDVNWGQFSHRCPYLHPVTGAPCPVSCPQLVQWKVTRHAAMHVFDEIRAMREGKLGYCQGTIINSSSSYEKFRDCWFFCDKCSLVKDKHARAASIKLSLDPGTFMCQSCEDSYFASLKHFYRPR